MNRTIRFVLLSILMALTACSGGGGRAGGGGGGASSFTIGGNVTGLGSSTSMVVQLTTAAGAIRRRIASCPRTSSGRPACRRR